MLIVLVWYVACGCGYMLISCWLAFSCDCWFCVDCCCCFGVLAFICLSVGWLLSAGFADFGRWLLGLCLPVVLVGLGLVGYCWVSQLLIL